MQAGFDEDTHGPPAPYTQEPLNPQPASRRHQRPLSGSSIADRHDGDRPDRHPVPVDAVISISRAATSMRRAPSVTSSSNTNDVRSPPSASSSHASSDIRRNLFPAGQTRGAIHSGLEGYAALFLDPVIHNIRLYLWSVLEWVQGDCAGEATITSLDQAATDLAHFVLALREVPTANAPTTGNYRAFGLAGVDADFRDWLASVPDYISIHLWSSRYGTHVSRRRMVFATFLGSHRSEQQGHTLIARDGRLEAVIDWEGCTVGDPSVDHLAAWAAFALGDSRETFRIASGASKDTWFRAMGWVLFMSVTAIPDYTDTNPTFARQARRALDEIVVDYPEHT